MLSRILGIEKFSTLGLACSCNRASAKIGSTTTIHGQSIQSVNLTPDPDLDTGLM